LPFIDLGQNPSELISNTKKILKQLRGIGQTDYTKRRYLSYSIQADDHNHCGVVADKNIDIIKLLVDHLDSMSIEISPDDILNSAPDIFHNMQAVLGSDFSPGKPQDPYLFVKQYGEHLVNSPSVDLEEFSEFVELIISDRRGNCSSTSWVEI
jgi:hypothetical protein